MQDKVKHSKIDHRFLAPFQTCSKYSYCPKGSICCKHDCPSKCVISKDMCDFDYSSKYFKCGKTIKAYEDSGSLGTYFAVMICCVCLLAIMRLLLVVKRSQKDQDEENELIQYEQNKAIQQEENKLIQQELSNTKQQNSNINLQPLPVQQKVQLEQIEQVEQKEDLNFSSKIDFSKQKQPEIQQSRNSKNVGRLSIVDSQKISDIQPTQSNADQPMNDPSIVDQPVIQLQMIDQIPQQPRQEVAISSIVQLLEDSPKPSLEQKPKQQHLNQFTGDTEYDPKQVQLQDFEVEQNLLMQWHSIDQDK